MWSLFLFFFAEKDPDLFHEFIRSTKYPKHNKNYIEVFGPPNDHYCRRRAAVAAPLPEPACHC